MIKCKNNIGNMPEVALKTSSCWSMFDLSTNECSTFSTECTFHTCSHMIHLNIWRKKM